MACGIQIAKLINTLFNKEREKKKKTQSPTETLIMILSLFFKKF